MNPPNPHPSGRFYRPELDVVRFLAFFLVFLNHSIPRSLDSRTFALPKLVANSLITFGAATSFGLSLFFTLSAFLICELLLRERDATGSVLVKSFYVRRILRIWPLYFSGIIIGLLISWHFIGGSGAFAWAAWSALMMGNWYVGSHSFGGGPMGVLWSISVEEQFYLFAPWIMKYLNRLWLYGVCITLIVLSNLQLFYLGRIRVYDFTVWINSLVQFQNFAAGIILCIILHRRKTNTTILSRLALIVGGGCCWYYACNGFGIHYQGDLNPGSWSLIGGYGLGTLGCCFVLLAFLGLSPRLLPSWAIYLGRISYGLYVFHDLAIWAAGLIFNSHHTTIGSAVFLQKGASAFGLTVLMGAVSYRYFETPFLRLKKRYEIIASRPI
jgi:peptidoglycan/LPS O-acetylase OafA/YrhL